MLADRYKDEPAVAGYDLLNEPVTKNVAALNRFGEDLIPPPPLKRKLFAFGEGVYIFYIYLYLPFSVSTGFLKLPPWLANLLFLALISVLH